MRGQGSTEYLVIFGAVLVLTVLVVYLALQYFGSWSKQNLVDQSLSYWKAQKPIGIIKTTVSGSSAKLVFYNNDDHTVTLHTLYLWSQEGSQTYNLDIDLAPGQPQVTTITLPFSCHATGEVIEFSVVKMTYYDSQISETETFDEVGTAPLRFICS